MIVREIRRSRCSLRMTAAAAILLSAGACKKAVAPVPYQAVPVERRDIVVSAQASGAVQPDTTVEVKSGYGLTVAAGSAARKPARTSGGSMPNRTASPVWSSPRRRRRSLLVATSRT